MTVTPVRAYWLGVMLIAVGFCLSPFKYVGVLIIGAAWIWYAFDLANAEEEDVAEPPSQR